MPNKKTTFAIGFALCLIGFLYSFINDPFIVPFQDWDAFTTEQKQSIIDTDKTMNKLWYGSLIGSAILCILWILLSKKSTRTPKRSR
jgi:hypothetical protein